MKVYYRPKLARKTQSPGKGKNGLLKEVGYTNLHQEYSNSPKGKIRGFPRRFEGEFNGTKWEQKGNNSRH
jgi:hypothetical protein